LPTALDNGQRSPWKLIGAASAARVFFWAVVSDSTEEAV
jgi:hypothetical protein